MIHLDTHVLLWLSRGDFSALSAGARELVEAEDLAISPMVEFELQVLHEVQKAGRPDVILGGLRRDIGLVTDSAPLGPVVLEASGERFAFTRDPFDRMIAAHASVAGVRLLTKDRKLRNNLEFAIWP